ncbi:MAG: hypothetical protein OXD47_08665 [Gammaproteobacteria bacterium]|nr:hypothetical protein [Gammaproteobacteria bacterium]
MEVNYMETTMNELLPDKPVPATAKPQPDAVSRTTPRTGRSGDDVVRWAEFRLALWAGAFALTVLISSQGLLYSAILGLKDDIGIMRAEIGVLRTDMQTQFGEAYADRQKQIGELRADMQKQFGELRAEVQELRERMVRIETHLGMGIPAADNEN